MQYRRFFVIGLIVLILAESRAYAYTDPGSGTLIWQLLIGAAVGVMFYFRKIVYWVRSRTRKDSPSPVIEKSLTEEGEQLKQR